MICYSKLPAVVLSEYFWSSQSTLFITCPVCSVPTLIHGCHPMHSRVNTICITIADRWMSNYEVTTAHSTERKVIIHWTASKYIYSRWCGVHSLRMSPWDISWGKQKILQQIAMQYACHYKNSVNCSTFNWAAKHSGMISPFYSQNLSII
jgi:hypothetical protein